MGFHHVAIAARDIQETHRFYSDVMGFELIKAVVAPTPKGGWAKHVFYDTGGDGLIAFWDIHDRTMEGFDPAISTGLGLDTFINHIAFAASDLDDIGARRQRMLDHGHDVMEIDHAYCVSIYTMDPNGIMVEFCTDTKPYTEDDKAYARSVLTDAEPALEVPPNPVFHRSEVKATAPA
jgi:catechol 2,3-dioxygenase-like lactoylglutathione lyase family enzyme